MKKILTSSLIVHVLFLLLYFYLTLSENAHENLKYLIFFLAIDNIILLFADLCKIKKVKIRLTSIDIVSILFFSFIYYEQFYVLPINSNVIYYLLVVTNLLLFAFLLIRFDTVIFFTKQNQKRIKKV